MIDAKVIINISKKAGIRAERIERDYVMGLILDALSRCDETKDTVMFKGGTCVHKCFSSFTPPENPKQLDDYFLKGRFSSDIDLTVSKKIMSPTGLYNAFLAVGNYVEKKHGLILQNMSFPLHYNEEQDKTNSKAELHYCGPLYLLAQEKKKEKEIRTGEVQKIQAPPSLKLDITADEKVVYSPVLRPIYHPYPTAGAEEQNLQACCYTFQGIFAEKMRAMFERASPRDLYDLHTLYDSPELAGKKLEIGRALVGKFRFKKMPLNLDEQHFLQPQDDKVSLKDYCREEWDHSLAQQVSNLGRFEDYWDDKKFPQILAFAKQCMDMALMEEKTLQQNKEKHTL